MSDAETNEPKRLLPIADAELRQPHVGTVFKLILNAFLRIRADRTAFLIASAFVLLLLWGTHGKVDVLGMLWDGWHPGASDDPLRAAPLFGIPWDQEWISFAIGAVLLVLVPAAIIKLRMKRNLRDFGLGPPLRHRGRLTILSAIVLFVVTLPAFWLGAHDAGMADTYPLYRGFVTESGRFDTMDFVIWELGYLPFFLVIEFVFRGYLLFGLFGVRDAESTGDVTGVRGPRLFGYYAILISMLSYTAWHLGKPVPEVFGTLVWGLAAGSVALATGTIWHIVIVHWLLNVFLDLAIIQGW